MISKGGSYIKKNGKLTRVSGTEEPKAADASGGVSSLPQAEAEGAAASADPGNKPKKGA